MKRKMASVVCCVLLMAGWSATKANAQAAEAQAHVAAAKAASYEPGQDLTNIFGICAEPRPAPAVAAPPAAPAARRIPPRNQWYTEPAKVFDNLYYVGGSEQDNNTVWAVTTSEGIILIDAGYDYSVEELVVNGLKKLGLDPAQIKYVLLTTAKPQTYGGAKLLQDRYKPRVALSNVDWTVIEKANQPAEIKPKRDMVITDGQKVTLGDVTVTLYITPGNSPGTVSMIISPLKDGNQRHVGSHFGGRAAFQNGDGVAYFPTEIDSIRTWGTQAKRYKEIAEKAGADVFLSPRVNIDKTLDKINAIQFRKPGGPHPLVNKAAVSRGQTIIYECMQAQLAFRAAK